MIALAASLLLWVAAPNGATGEALAPGSLEDCLAWSMADFEAATEADSGPRRAAVSRLMAQHFQEMIEGGAPTTEILRRQRRLHRIALTRSPETGKTERAVCERNFPTPTWSDRP
jgi:hypothetical protein